ncbi:hypothetical protein BGZ80_011340 [Entomortierella chlamydospora]|uniref:Uncharacterized protein n=1 Tax=Entomortierella chlamydospora TaxID=101097 RepID=A0A9P6N2G6_9FUNG|nr:hypothetical protein BGZ79_001471 [Entomortierella chlamydospora]KAG0022734.1 hypothetical protein BGZ80_011340 [Entomortierella chlamydospora]
MANADEILSIIAAVLYFILLGHFAIRFARSIWWIYFFLAFFCTIRVAAYIMRAYVGTMVVTHANENTYIALLIADTTLLSIGVIFILLILARLYHSILPKLRHSAGHTRGKFEATLVDRTRLVLLPIIVCFIVGAVFASPGYTAEQAHIGDILRKVAAIGLLIVGFIFLYAAWNYRQRYPENQHPFHICLAITALFVVTMIYKIVYTFNTGAQTATWAFFVFSPLIELIALAILSIDIQTHFLGRPEDKIDIEK